MAATAGAGASRMSMDVNAARAAGLRKGSYLSLSKDNLTRTDATSNKPVEEVVVERILRAGDPNVMSTPVYFDFRRDARTYKFVPSVGNTAVHFALDGVNIRKDSPEALQQAEDAARRQREFEVAAEAELNPELIDEGVSTRILKNQFNYSDRGSQTMNNVLKEQLVLTDPPPSISFGGTATAWAIYDAYEADRAQNEKSSAAHKKSVTRRVSKEEMSAAGQGGLDGGDGSGGDATNNGPQSAVLSSSRFGSALRVMERMVNQNDCFDIIDDFKYWEDQSDLYKEDGTLLPLWQFYTEPTRKRAVTSLALNNGYTDFFAVGYGSYDFQKPCRGTVHCFTLKNAVPTVAGASLPAHPEFSFRTESGVLCLAFHPTETALLAVGLYSGAVCVYDLRVKGDKQRSRPIYQSTIRTGTHTGPLWEIYWTNSTRELAFYSVSSDGRISRWVMNKKELTAKEVLSLSTGVCTPDPEQMALNQLCGTCFDYSPVHDKVVVGTREGSVLLCTTSFNGQCVERYEGHTMSVYTTRWNAFHPDIFLTCSADWTVKLWLRSSTQPLLTFDLGDSVSDVAWAPYSATVFAAVTGNGKVYIFDLHQNKTEPLCVQTVVKNAKLTHIVFSRVDPIVLVGDTRGTVLTLKLSPNLRKVSKPVKKDNDEETTVTQLEMDKLSRLVDITLKDRALLSTM